HARTPWHGSRPGRGHWDGAHGRANAGTVPRLRLPLVGMPAFGPAARAAGESAPLRLVEPDPLEPVEVRRGVLDPALHVRLAEIDVVSREEPEVWHVLEDHDLDLVVDLLALLLVERPPTLLQEPVQVRNAPAVPVLPLGGVEGPEEGGVGVAVSGSGVHGQVEVLREP